MGKARDEVERLFGGAARVDQKMAEEKFERKLEEEKGGVDNGEMWHMGEVEVDVGLPPTHEEGQDAGEDAVVAEYWQGRGADEQSTATDLGVLEEADELGGMEDSDMWEGLEKEEAGGEGVAGKSWTEDLRNAHKKRIKKLGEVSRLGRVRPSVFDKKA